MRNEKKNSCPCTCLLCFMLYWTLNHTCHETNSVVVVSFNLFSVVLFYNMYHYIIILTMIMNDIVLHLSFQCMSTVYFPGETVCRITRNCVRNFARTRIFPPTKICEITRNSAHLRWVGTSLMNEYSADSFRSCMLSSHRPVGYNVREFGVLQISDCSKTSR